MGRLISKKLDISKNKGKKNISSEKETKQDQRLKKKELRKQHFREKDYATNEEKDFSLALLGLQLKIKYMDGDGNCLFRSIADQLTGECSNHHGIRMLVVTYIEKHKDHFSLFMEDDETFEDYIDRMKTVGEWGGHQELYAASQSLRVNIIVHQCSSSAPRFILSCDNATRDIHLSYHGECHYNSVHQLMKDSGIHDFLEMKRSLAALDEKPKSALETAVSRALPWSSSSDQIQLALKMCGNDLEAAVELLMINPDGFGDISDKSTAVVSIAEAAEKAAISSSHYESARNGIIENCAVDFNEDGEIETVPTDPKPITDPVLIRAARRTDRLRTKTSVSKKQARKDLRNIGKDSSSHRIESPPLGSTRTSHSNSVGADGVREVFL